jgi:hypothetical protein
VHANFAASLDGRTRIVIRLDRKTLGREQRAARRRMESETFKFNYQTWLVLQQIADSFRQFCLGLSESVSIGLNISLPSEFDGRKTFVSRLAGNLKLSHQV